MSEKKFLTGIELIQAPKQIGSVEPAEGKEFKTFEFTANNEKIYLKAKGVPSPIKASSFNNKGKLQLALDCQADGVLLLCAEQIKQEIKQALDTECEPDLKVTVKSWVKNKVLWLSWPKGKGGAFDMVLVNDKPISPDSEDFAKLQETLKKYQLTKMIEVGFALYTWVRYEKNAEGILNNQITVGLSPQLAYIKFDE